MRSIVRHVASGRALFREKRQMIGVCSLSIFVWISGLGLPGPAFAQTRILPLESQIRSLLREYKVSENEISLYVGSPKGAGSVVEISGSRSLIPASISKIVTAALVLKSFPPGTRFVTELRGVEEPRGGVLRKDLYLRGGGDPSFVSENLWFLVNHFVRSQVTRIEGDIVVDDRIFDQLRFDPSRQDVRVDRAYDAPNGGMSFNWNSVNLFVRPGAKAGEPAVVFADPANSYIELRNLTKTTNGRGSANLSVDRDPTSGGDRITVTGSIPLGAKEVTIYNNITKPDLWSGENLRSFLSQRGITVAGKVRAGSSESADVVLARSESKTVEQIVADMNKFSNNFVAEMLAKSVSAKEGKAPGNIPHAMKLAREYLTGLGLTDAEAKVVNPSGLTRDNRLSARAMVRVLEDLKSQLRFQPEFFSSLPIGGVDGTLRNRMKGEGLVRHVRAKTGLLTGVTSLAGYVEQKDGEILPFAFIYNGKDDGSQMREMMDRLCDLIRRSSH